MRKPLIDRIVAIPMCGCWIWDGCLFVSGYGCISINGKSRRAHRVFYEEFNGPIPEGKVLDHLCRVKSCVNPDHLEAVSFLTNVRRGNGGKFHKSKTHCPQGHPYEGENLYTFPSGGRQCKICRRVSMRKYGKKYRERKRNERRTNNRRNITSKVPE